MGRLVATVGIMFGAATSHVMGTFGWILLGSGLLVLAIEGAEVATYERATAEIVAVREMCDVKWRIAAGAVSKSAEVPCIHTHRIAELTKGSVSHTVKPYADVVVRYTTAAGRTVKASARASRLAIENPVAGQPVAIIYRPSYPQRVRNPLRISDLGLFGGAALSGLLLLLVRRRIARSAAGSKVEVRKAWGDTAPPRRQPRTMISQKSDPRAAPVKPATRQAKPAPLMQRGSIISGPWRA